MITTASLEEKWQRYFGLTGEERGVTQVLADAAQYGEDNGPEDAADILEGVGRQLIQMAAIVRAMVAGDALPCEGCGLWHEAM